MPTSARLFGYPIAWLSSDAVAGITLAAYAVPVSLAYATLAGLPPQIGVYGYLLGGLGYALAGTTLPFCDRPHLGISRLAIGAIDQWGWPTATACRHAQIATGAALVVGLLRLLAWVLRPSVSSQTDQRQESAPTGFKAGAGPDHSIDEAAGSARRAGWRRRRCPESGCWRSPDNLVRRTL